MRNQIIQGDCLAVLKTLPDNSIDAIVTDPPAGIAFMSKDWDKDKGGRDAWVNWLAEIMAEARRVLKPGGHALVWSLPRTSHWTAYALENAGFEIRDSITHVTGQGMPKSLDVTKAARKAGLACNCQRNDVYYPIKGVHHDYRPTEDTTDRQDLRNLRETMDSDNALSSGPQQDMQQGMQQHKCREEEQETISTYGNLPAMRETIPPEKQYASQNSQVLHSIMQRSVQASASRTITAIEEDSPVGFKRLDGRGQEEPSGKDDRPEQSSMERRGNVQTPSWELQGRDLRTMPARIQNDGTQEQLGYAASASNGSTFGTTSNPSGSGTSYRPQSEQQSYQQSSTIPQSVSTQTCGTCGKPIIQDGIGTGLKPACETWWLARSPLAEDTIAANILEYGVGGLNIDASRIGYANEGDLANTQAGTNRMKNSARGEPGMGSSEGWARPWMQDKERVQEKFQTNTSGRWPSNFLLSHTLYCQPNGLRKVKGSHNGKTVLNTSTISPFMHSGKVQPYTGHTDEDGLETVEDWICTEDCPVRLLDEQSGMSKGHRNSVSDNRSQVNGSVALHDTRSLGVRTPENSYSDQGGASRYFMRFFYCSKSSKRERNAGCEGLPTRESGAPMNSRCANCGRLKLDHEVSRCKCAVHVPLEQVSRNGVQNNHPTVKPLSLMRYLVRMITPPGGIVLDCFGGSGTTALACIAEGFDYLIIEQSSEYCAIAEARVQHALKAAGQERTQEPHVGEWDCSPDCPVRMLDEQTKDMRAAKPSGAHTRHNTDDFTTSVWRLPGVDTHGHEDMQGGASRFFMQLTPDTNEPEVV